MSDKAWIMVTYCIYCVAWMFFSIGVPSYAVFVLNANPLWMFMVLLAGTGYKPWRWYGLMDGVERPRDMTTKS